MEDDDTSIMYPLHAKQNTKYYANSKPVNKMGMVLGNLTSWGGINILTKATPPLKYMNIYQIDIHVPYPLYLE